METQNDPITEFNDLRRIALEKNGDLTDEQLSRAVELAIEARGKTGAQKKKVDAEKAQNVLDNLGEQLKSFGAKPGDSQ